jgi:probable rRNA maturation factor
LQFQLPKSDIYELTLRLTNDAEIQSFNSQYRQQNKPTDVLAFAALEAEMPIFQPEDPEPLYLGDIIISLETAAVQAQQNNHSLTIELAWLASHGLLHLLGWDHPDDVRLEEMLAQQANLLKQVGFTEIF